MLGSSSLSLHLKVPTCLLVLRVVVVVFITPGRTDLIGPVATLSYSRIPRFSSILHKRKPYCSAKIQEFTRNRGKCLPKPSHHTPFINVDGVFRLDPAILAIPDIKVPMNRSRCERVEPLGFLTSTHLGL
ncbi:hypothetical protein HZ326_30109 [Fusarium oxysporum f. sp. albedinis]|nr:hypothetical protein HZ326_30109 [Fusarium oxysporum f. sp. albedinis]